MLIEELTPSTNHEYISSKYNNENKEECEQKLDTPPQLALDTNRTGVKNEVEIY